MITLNEVKVNGRYPDSITIKRKKCPLVFINQNTLKVFCGRCANFKYNEVDSVEINYSDDTICSQCARWIEEAE